MKVIRPSAWCLQHNRYCRIYEQLASLHLAGTPCIAFSSIGSLDREGSISYIHFLIWVALRKRRQESVVAQECVSTFPREPFLLLMPEYEFTFHTMNPVDYGWPINRERQFIVGQTRSQDTCVQKLIEGLQHSLQPVPFWLSELVSVLMGGLMRLN
ncbi:unnamed protein product [Durusdinium trenchii]|uniref:Uncharacterized protein n=1 Tax=Durusdinium trenchii TaxID=1381693 RepID=A0ABP0N2M1_9DINO